MGNDVSKFDVGDTSVLKSVFEYCMENISSEDLLEQVREIYNSGETTEEKIREIKEIVKKGEKRGILKGVAISAGLGALLLAGKRILK